MPMDIFRALVDEISDKVFFLNLYNWGEPLLHPQIFDMVEYATSRGLSVRISSSLNSMTSVQARLMVESGLEELLVDLDGATQETYEIYRVGGLLARVVENIREVTSAKKSLNTPFPLITARVLVTKYNYHELSQIRTLAWNLGVDRFFATPIHVNLGRSDDIDRWVVQRSIESANPPGKPRKCDQLWFNLTISWDGGVFPCCWFHEQEYDFGNVYEEGKLTMIWNNERFVQSRNFVAGKTAHLPGTICGRCKGYPQYYYSY
jgi:radical SAM protein with 4Fe4S-binding SPASM domain